MNRSLCGCVSLEGIGSVWRFAAEEVSKVMVIAYRVDRRNFMVSLDYVSQWGCGGGRRKLLQVKVETGGDIWLMRGLSKVVDGEV